MPLGPLSFRTNVGQTDWHFSSQQAGLVDPPCSSADDRDFPFAKDVTVIFQTSGYLSYQRACERRTDSRLPIYAFSNISFVIENEYETNGIHKGTFQAGRWMLVKLTWKIFLKKMSNACVFFMGKHLYRWDENNSGLNWWVESIFLRITWEVAWE